MGPEFLSSTGTGVWRNAPGALPDSSSVLDQFQLGGRFGYFLFFFGSGRGKGESEAAGGVVDFLLEIPEGGGLHEEGPRGREGVCGKLGIFGGGGGLNIFFRGRNVHQVSLRNPILHVYRSIQIDHRQTPFLGGINFQLQIQNRAARRINSHYRDRSVGISAQISHYRYRFSLEFQLISITDTEFGLKTT